MKSATHAQITRDIYGRRMRLPQFAAVLVFAIFCSNVQSVLAAPFATKAALKTAVINCLAAAPSGLNCCSSGGADCGAAGNVDMPDWDTSQVTSFYGLF